MAAKESADQTSIMRSTLETTRARDVFEEHRLSMYYLAKYIYYIGRNISFNYKVPGLYKTMNFLNYDKSTEISDNLTSIDKIFEHFLRTVNNNLAQIEHAIGADPDIANYMHTLEYVIDELVDIINREEFQNNRLVQARMTGIDADLIHENSVGLYRMLSAVEQERF